MEELYSMLERALPWNWGIPKIASAILLAGIIYAWREIRRGKVKRHAWIMGVTLFVLISVSVHGVATRGALGTLVSEDHTLFYRVVAYVHLIAGGIYFILGLLQVLTVGIFRARFRGAMRYHRVLGRVAASLAVLSIACLFFLK